MSILESGRHKPFVVNNLTLVTPSYHGREAFSTPGALTHTKITWALSPWRHKSRASLQGPLCAHGVACTHGKVRNKHR